MKNVVRGVLALALTALATWLANEIAEAIFGPDEEEVAANRLTVCRFTAGLGMLLRPEAGRLTVNR